MPTNKKATSKQVARIASKEMKSTKKNVRTIAASDLAQVVPNKETSKKVASKSAKILRDTMSTKQEKKVGGSTLGQTSLRGKKSMKKSKK